MERCVNCGTTEYVSKHCTYLERHDKVEAPLCWRCFDQNGGKCAHCEIEIGIADAEASKTSHQAGCDGFKPPDDTFKPPNHNFTRPRDWSPETEYEEGGEGTYDA